LVNSLEAMLPMFMTAVGQCPLFKALLPQSDNDKMHSL